MRSARKEEGVLGTIVSIVTLIIGATTVFAALESALRQIWGSRDAAISGWRGFLRTRLISFGFVLAVGFLLLVSLTLSTAVSGMRDWVVSASRSRGGPGCRWIFCCPSRWARG